MGLYKTEDYFDIVLCNSQFRYVMVHKDDNDGTYSYTHLHVMFYCKPYSYF